MSIIFAPSQIQAKLVLILGLAIVLVAPPLCYLIFPTGPWFFGAAIALIMGTVVIIHGVLQWRWSRYAYQFFEDYFHVSGRGRNEKIMYRQIAEVVMEKPQRRKGTQTIILNIKLHDPRKFRLVDQKFTPTSGASRLLFDIAMLIDGRGKVFRH